MSTFPIYPSMISADFARLGEQVAELEAAGAAALHFDVMDGQFVPNLTFGALVLQALRPLTRLPFYTHLMVFTPENLIKPLADAGANRLYLHPEATPHIHRWVEAVKDAGLEVGISLNPGTPTLMLEPLLPLVDAVLIMSVDPGFGGQAFQPSSLGRVAQTRALMDRLGVSPVLECDGGVDAQTIRPLVEAGMTGAVIGSALFRDGDLAGALRRMQQAAQG
ncbi:MAG: ribulose-phosphate 3-epimerase [Armatimonadota bacterium]